MRFALLLLLCHGGWAAGDPVKGKELFKSCLGCHNADTDQRKMGPSLRTLFGKVMLINGKRANEENVRTLVLEGYNQMPAFRSFLTDEQVSDLMAYLVTLNAKVNTASGSGSDSAFRTWCVSCHDPRKYGERGPDLRGLAAKGKFSSGQAVTETALRRLMDDGHGTAPPLKQWLDEPSRQAILNYLKTY
jgi:mono/diheme cytochrome c family protein